MNVWWWFGLVAALTFSLTACVADDIQWDEVVLAAVRKLGKAYAGGRARVDLLGHDCSFRETRTPPFISSIFTCPGWTNIKGTALAVNRFGVVDEAVRDFFKQALDEGLLTLDDAKEWLMTQDSPGIFMQQPVRHSLVGLH